jgi:SNF2 family DNA or RNA helicase
MGGFEQRQVIGYKDLPDLQRRAATIMYSMPKSLLTLPPIVESTLPVRLGPTAARAHAEMKKYLRTRIVSGEITAANGLVKLLRLQQITSGYLPDENGSLRCIGNEKHDALVEQLDSMPRDARVVVFSRFTHDVRQIIDAAREDHRHAFELSGEKDEREAWKQSKDGVLAEQIQAGGTGIDDLAPNAHFCVFYSVGYSLSDFIQAHERLHRPGQTETTTFIHLVAMGTIDEVVAEALAKREDLVNAVLEGIRKGT